MTKSAYAANKLKESDENDAWTKLFDLFSPNTRVLDLGCSSGNFGNALKKQKSCYVVGVDINEDDLRLAAKRLDKTVKRNLEADDLADLGVFDYVLMADVIEHLIDPVSVLKKVKKLLKKGGKLVFSVPNMANIATRIELLGGRFEYTTYGLLDQTHLHYYDRVELEKVLTQAGLKVTKYNNTIRNVPAAVLKNQLTKLGLTPNAAFMQLASHIDAITFQFIGMAEPTSHLKSQTEQVATKTPHDFMSQYIDALQQKLGSEIEQLKHDLEHQKQANKAVMQEKQAALRAMRTTQQTLDKIQRSKGWRLLTKLYSAKHRLAKALGRK